jgi:hypothetical protein
LMCSSMKFATVPNPKRGKWPFYYKEAGKSWGPAIFLQPERLNQPPL